MDKFTRNYLVGLALIAIAVLAWFLLRSPVVAELNERLAADPTVADYPYQFRVQRLEDGVATMNTPRSAEVPAFRSLQILFPGLREDPPGSPAMLEAQQTMSRVQMTARAIVESDERVSRVDWELDERWLGSHGVQPGP